MKQSLARVALAVGLLASSGSTSGSNARALFLSGTPAPSGLPFASFGRAAVNARGTVCFLAGWDGLRHRPEGLFIRQGEQVTPIARAGDPIPGSAGDRFSFVPDYPDDFASFSLNSQDEIAFIVRQGLFLYSGRGVRPVIRIGDEVPGVPDERWDEIDTVSLNNAGAVAFTGAIRSVTDGERQEGVFLLTGDSVKIALFDGDQPADLEGELNSFAAVSLNDSGAMAVLATEGDDGLACILLATDAETRAIAIEGKPAPDGVWSGLASVALNNHGTIAFQARVAADAGDHGGIYRASGGAVTPVAVPGQPFGTDGAELLGDDWGRPIIDDAGTLAFLAERVGSRQTRAIILAGSGPLTTLASVGAPAPGGGGMISRFSGLNLGSMNAEGLVCGVSLLGGSVADTLVRYRSGSAPEILLTTDSLLPPGGLLTLADSQTPSRNVQARLNRSGEMLFAADVGGYGRALFSMRAGSPELLTPLNRPSAGAPGLRSVLSFDLSDAGQVVFLGTRDEADQEMTLLAMDLHTATPLRLVAATGAAVPGAPDRLLTRLGTPAIDGSGLIYFAAVAQAPSDPSALPRSLLLRGQSDHLEILIDEGQSIEGTGALAAPPGSDPGAAPLFREFHVNAAGQALFLSTYQDQKTGASNPAGLFLLSDGMVRVLALPGQIAPILGAPVYTGFSSPRLSDDGAVTFAATVAGAGRKPRAGLFRRDAAGAVTVAATGDPVPGWDGESYRAVLDPVTSAAGVAFLALLEPPPTAGASAALLISTGGPARAALRDGDPVDGAGSSSFRVDDRFPPAPLALEDDGSLLVAAQLRGEAAPDGLFLLQPP